MDGNARSAANQKKPIIADNDLVELLWHNGSVVAQPQAHQRAAPSDRPSSSGLTGEETAAWFPDTFDDALEKDLYTQLWYSSIADASQQHGDALPGPSSQPPPMGSGVESSWAGDICSTFCGSNQVFSSVPVGDAALPSEAPRGASTQDGAGTGTSSSGGSGSNFGGSRLRSDSGHVHQKKGRCRDDSDSRSEDIECEATEETKSSRRYGSKRRARAAEVHNLSERRRRDRINEKMRTLQELIPHCNKVTDKASILDETIEYLKSLQMQVQMQNIHFREISNQLLYPDGEQTAAPQVPGPHAYGRQATQAAQHSRVPELPANTVVPTSTAGQPPTYDRV
ncbi:hypothetical protein PR202_ga13694 [Eleusine coracana subsp. coracana]|uniref:BHLH domain-containing protein n=1 Tax=Eleusine coracana subsp. coracana TaxID=191504 RepID=A0AAV5CFM4_ELECO|nr:hypothetical protein PR202_ga13694 [Eleusine coracana subsp. coracana]